MKKLALLFFALPLVVQATPAITQSSSGFQSATPVAPPAAQCSGLIQLASVELVTVPGTDLVAAPVVINGTRENLLVSTSGGATSLTLNAVHSLGLNVNDTGSSRFLDASGYASHSWTYLKNVKLDRLLGTGMLFLTTPNPNFGKYAQLDGVLAADLMANYDVEIDFDGHRMNYYSPDHCAGQVIYWPAQQVGVTAIKLINRAQDELRGDNPGRDAGLTMVVMEALYPAYIPARSHMLGEDVRVNVMLDGKPFVANIDTGQEVSTLSTNAARAVYGVTADSPDSATADAALNEHPVHPGVSETVMVRGTKLFMHTFHTLILGGVTVNSPQLLVQPDITGAYDPRNDVQLNSLIRREDDFPRPDVTIGMDVLRHLRLYFAFKERKLYVTPAGASPANTAG